MTRARASPFLPAAVALHVGLLVIWLLPGPATIGASLRVASEAGTVLGGPRHPMALWALLNGVAAVLLLAGWARHARHLRLIGWVWGSAIITFLASTQWITVARSPAGSLSGPLFTTTAVLAHIAAAWREAEG